MLWAEEEPTKALAEFRERLGEAVQYWSAIGWNWPQTLSDHWRTQKGRLRALHQVFLSSSGCCLAIL